MSDLPNNASPLGRPAYKYVQFESVEPGRIQIEGLHYEEATLVVWLRWSAAAQAEPAKVA